MDIALLFGIISLVTERATEWVKKIFHNKIPERVGDLSIYLIISFILAEVIVFGMGINFFDLAGIPLGNRVFGIFITGFAVSGGSNFISDASYRVMNPSPRFSDPNLFYVNTEKEGKEDI